MPLTVPAPEILYLGRSFCFTGVFEFGSRADCHEAVLERGGEPAKGVTKKLDYLVIALPTVAAAMVGVALKDTLTRFFSGIELGKIVKVGDWVSVLDREGIVTHIGMEHVTLFSRAHDVVSLPNDLVIQSGVTNYTRPTTTHLCNVFVDAAYRTPARRRLRDTTGGGGCGVGRLAGAQGNRTGCGVQ